MTMPFKNLLVDMMSVCPLLFISLSLIYIYIYINIYTYRQTDITPVWEKKRCSK